MLPVHKAATSSHALIFPLAKHFVWVNQRPSLSPSFQLSASLPPSLSSSFLLPFSTTVKYFNGNFKSLLASETSVLPLLPESPRGVCQLHFKKEPLRGGIASGQLWSPLLSSGPALSCWELGGICTKGQGKLVAEDTRGDSDQMSLSFLHPLQHTTSRKEEDTDSFLFPFSRASY